MPIERERESHTRGDSECATERLLELVSRREGAGRLDSSLGLALRLLPSESKSRESGERAQKAAAPTAQIFYYCPLFSCAFSHSQPSFFGFIPTAIWNPFSSFILSLQLLFQTTRGSFVVLRAARRRRSDGRRSIGPRRHFRAGTMASRAGNPRPYSHHSSGETLRLQVPKRSELPNFREQDKRALLLISQRNSHFLMTNVFT